MTLRISMLLIYAYISLSMCTSNAFSSHPSKLLTTILGLPSALKTQQSQSSRGVLAGSFNRDVSFCLHNRRASLDVYTRATSRCERKKWSLCALPGNFSTDNLVIVSFAIILGVAAQGFINSMLSGDRGLGAFLSDGSGFNKSNFKPADRKSKTEDNAPLSGTDPLPWLKLPKLSYVEVAGQAEEEITLLSEGAVREKLESLAEEIRNHVKNGDLKLAKETQAELEKRLEEFGFEFNNDFQ